jgi:CHASE2 domain-containing sensor protein
MKARLDRLKNRATELGARLVRRLGPRAYLWLAAAFSIFVIADFSVLHLVGTMERRIFDQLISKRLHTAKPDADIVIVDIDEASLAAMAKDYGRWPWPNQVFGEFVAGVEKQNPKAIVFDILFSDPDVTRPESDAYFNQVIAGSKHTYFPMLRLAPDNDHLSQIRPSMLPGVTPLPGVKTDDKPIAMVLPQVPAAIANGRLATHNVAPDKDSVIRRYPFYLEHGGWRIPSMPSRVAEGLGHAPVIEQQDFLINWRGGPFAYHYVSFADVYRDLLRQHPEHPDQFAGKVVVIGSTAPSLFDIKASPMATIHPGVEVLATVIDNVKNDDWLREQPLAVTMGMSLIFIWGMAVALAKQTRVEIFDSVFTAVQASFVAISYATLNFSNEYLDMSAPITLGLGYFSLARIYAGMSHNWLANGQRHRLEGRDEGSCRMAVLSVRLDAPTGGERRRLKEEVNRLVAASPLQASRITQLIADPGLVHGLFENLTLIYWLTDQGEDCTADADHIEAELSRALAHAAQEGRLSFARHGGDLRWTQRHGWQKEAYQIIVTALAQGAPADDAKRLAA